jgi:glutathione S-transferase
MSQPESKRVKTEEPTYELFYWPGIPGRGEFVRLLFEEAGVPFTDHADNPKDDVAAITAFMDDGNVGDDFNPPLYAPPILRHGDIIINQVSNILLYLAPKLGLGPSEGPAVYHLNAIVATILDALVNELHETHHPIATGDYYENQKPEAKKRSKDYLETRLPKFFTYFQRLLDAKTSDEGPWLYGSNLTYADLVLFQVRESFAHKMTFDHSPIS